MNKKIVFLPYDFDTAIGINNEGALVFSYNLEDIDQTQSGADVFNGQQSVLWINMRQAFFNQMKEMYQTLRSQGKLSYALVEQMFENHQGKWPEAIFNEDAWFKYLQPLVDDGDAAYLSMLQGSKAEQRKWWLWNRFRYLDSKYNAGDALTQVITLRGYAKSNITVTPYADIYAAVKYGSYLVQTRAARNQSYTLTCPLDNVNDTEIYIYSADQLASVGDLSGFKVGYANFAMATKLQSLKLGDSSANYSNGNLTELYLGNNVLLRTIDVRNCPALTQPVDLSGCSNIEYVYFDGTNITGLQLPNGGILKVLHVPDSITNLTIRNQTGITQFSIPTGENITTLRLENVSNAVNSDDILNNLAAGSRLRLIGFTWNVQTYEAAAALYDKLDTMRGLDENGGNMDHAQVMGTLHVESLTGAQIASLQERYPDITVTYDHLTSYLYYYNYDGSQLLHTDTITDGGDGTWNGTPSRTATAQYNYTFVGWSTSQDSQAATANCTRAVVADRSVYAAYSRTTRTYTVTWKNADGTTLETDTNVPYGTYPTYNGATPTYNGQTSRGWTPAVSSVTGNITYTASYIPVYTVRFYNGSTLLETVSVQQGNSATYSGATPVDAVNGYPFDGWSPSPTNVQANMDCYAQFKAPWEVAEITDSWDQIIAACANGTYASKYKPGNYKPLDLGAQGTVNMQIVAMGKDALANGGGNAPLTFISKELLATNHRMNPSRSGSSGNYTEGTGTIGGWEKCEMRTYLKETIKPLIPSNVRSAIKEVTKYSRIYNTAGSAVNDVTSTDDVWIPSYREVGFTGRETLGPIYDGAFPDNASRVKTLNGSAAWWWLRSAPSSNYFYIVYSDGSSNYRYATSAGGVALGFCL